MGYVFDFNDAKQYDAWFENRRNSHAFTLEMRLFMDMVSPHPGARLLDIGCGTGKSLEPLLDKELLLTGLDPSLYMLDLAKKKLGERADFHRGFAEALPFEDNAFDYALLFTTLEFTDRPAKAVEEACRVARESVFIGVLNSYAPLNLMRKAKGLFVSSTLASAHYFSIWELKQILLAILGDVPISWRTTLQCPWWSGRIATFFENQALVRRSPFGTMIGMEIKPVPKFRSRPLCLKLKKTGAYKPVSGFARNLFQDHHGDVNLRKTG